MSEIDNNREAQAVRDTVEMAFWGVSLEKIADELNPFIADGNQADIFNGRWRKKAGYDAFRRTGFVATHLTCSLYNDGLLEDVDMVFVDWDDGHRVFVDTLDLETEQRATNGLRPTPVDDEVLVAQVKSALCQLETIL